MKERSVLNNERQAPVVTTLLKNGYLLIKDTLGKRTCFKDDNSYSYEALMENIKRNQFPLLYEGLYYLLNLSNAIHGKDVIGEELVQNIIAESVYGYDKPGYYWPNQVAKVFKGKGFYKK